MEIVMQKLRDYQQETLTKIIEWLDRDSRSGPTASRSGPTASRSGPMRKLVAAPCGAGKGTLQLALVEARRSAGISCWLLTPSIEIMRGNLERLGFPVPTSSEGVARECFELGITTPVRFCNRLCSGEIEAPEEVIWDEVHGAIESNTIPSQLFALLAESKWVGFTATPYRATGKATEELISQWGQPEWMLRIPEAVERGFILAPNIEMRPLVDDDAIKLVNGDIDVRSSEAEYGERMTALCELIREKHSLGHRVIVSVPGTAMARELETELDVGNPTMEPFTYAVLQNTTGAQRAEIYQAAQYAEHRPVIIQIRVLSVGVDLPAMDCLIDCQPTLSGLLWLQSTGRIQRTHPGKKQPLLVVTNRNLERHAHLLEGLVPQRISVEAQEAFGKPSKRAGGASSIGFENLSKYKQLSVALRDGGWLTFYNLHAPDPTQPPGSFAEFFVGWLPGRSEPLAAKRSTVRREKDGSYKNGRWVRCSVPSDLSGFGTSKRTSGLSDKQKAWWERSAEAKGLAPEEAERITGREFTALPVACDARFHYHSDTLKPSSKPRTPSRSGPTASRSGPTDVRSGPTASRSGPTDVRSGPTDVRSGPMVFEWPRLGELE